MKNQPTPSPAQAPKVEIPRKTVVTLAVLVVTTALMVLNETSLTVGLAPIMVDLGVGADTVQWLITGFMLTMSVVIPTTGYLIERFSTRQVYLSAVALFLAGTLVAALAPVFSLLLLGRVIQAMGTALMMPLLMTVTMLLVPPQRRGEAMGIITVVISVAPALGPTAGGLVVDRWGWHGIFGCMLPLMALMGLWGFFKLPNAGENTIKPLDLVSVALSPFAFGGLVYAISSFDAIGSGSRRELVIGALGLVAMAVFVRRQLVLARADKALLNLRVFGYRNYSVATITNLLSFGVGIGSFTVLPIYLQSSLGVSAQVAGLMVLPGGLVQSVVSPFVGKAFDKVGPRPLLIPGTGLVATGFGLMTLLSPTTPLWAVVLMHCTTTLGIGLIITPLVTTALSSLPQPLYGQGSAALSTLQQFAAAIGTATLMLVLQRGIDARTESGWGVPEATAWGASKALAVAAGVSLLCFGLSFMVKRVQKP